MAKGLRALASLGQPLYLASAFFPPLPLLQEAPYSAILFVVPVFTTDHSRLFREVRDTVSR